MLPTMSMRPTGWFQVGWSTDLGVGDVRPLHYFGEDLVAYRDNDGVVHVLDAYCRHLGANLAYGGCVVDDGLQCPFHGWVWAPDGHNVRIPYQDRPNKARRLRAWPVHEANDVLLIWHDALGRGPLFDPPGPFSEIAPHLSTRTFHAAGPGAQSRFEGTAVHPQMVLENAVDPAHFAFVHRTPTIPVVLKENIDTYTWHSKVGFGGRWKDGADRAEDDLNTLHLKWWGTGVAYNALTDPERVNITLIACTPVDEHTTEVFGTYWPEVLPDDEQTGSHLRAIEQAKAALPDDLRIWNHQRFLARPALATSEAAGFRRIREWAETFYPDGERGPVGLLEPATAATV